MSVDVMMPFYGDVELFKLAVTSVQRQSALDWRLVVLDDRYPSDEPRRFIESLSDSRITYLVNDVNLGVSGNFQRSIELADAEYTVIMGCDDVMLPNYVDRVVELTRRFPTAAYVQPGVVTIDRIGNRNRPLGDRIKTMSRPAGPFPREMSGETLASSLLRANWTYFPSLCWETSQLKRHGFRPDFRVVLDLALQLALIADGGSLVVDDKPVFEYRRHHASVSSWAGSGSLRFAEESRLFRETEDKMRVLGWTRAARSARTHFTSRLNALVNLPAAAASRDSAGTLRLLEHAFGRTKT